MIAKGKKGYRSWRWYGYMQNKSPSIQMEKQ